MGITILLRTLAVYFSCCIIGTLQVVTFEYQVTSLADNQELPLESVNKVPWGIVNLAPIELPVILLDKITSTVAAIAARAW